MKKLLFGTLAALCVALVIYCRVYKGLDISVSVILAVFVFITAGMGLNLFILGLDDHKNKLS